LLTIFPVNNSKNTIKINFMVKVAVTNTRKLLNKIVTSQASTIELTSNQALKRNLLIKLNFMKRKSKNLNIIMNQWLIRKNKLGTFLHKGKLRKRGIITKKTKF